MSDIELGIKNIQNKRGIIPTKLKIRNFMSHRDTTVDFGDFTVIHSNKNGAGKTSIIEALMFVLTGKTIRTMGDLRVKQIIRRTASTAVVTMYGVYKNKEESDPKSIFIKRRRKKSGIDLIVRLDGETVQNADEFLKNEIDATTFSRITYINGHDVLLLLSGTPKETSELLDKLFGIDALETVKTSLSTISLQRKIKRLREKIQDAERLKDALSQRNNIDGEISEIDRKLNTFDEKLEELRSELNRINEREENARQTIHRYTDRKKKKEEISKNMEYIEERMDEIDSSLDNERVRKHGIEDMLDDLMESFDSQSPDEVIEEKKEKINEVESIIKSRDTIPSIITSVIENAESDEAECPVCGKRSLISLFEDQKDDFIGIHEERKEHLDFLKNEFMNLTAVKSRIDKLKTKKKSIEENIKRMQNEKRKNSNKYQRLEEELDEIGELDADLNEQKNILERGKSSEIRGRIKEIKTSMHNLRERKNSLLSEEEEAPQSEEEVPEIDELREKKERFERLLEKFKTYKDVLGESLKSVRTNYLEMVNEIINQYFQEFHQDVIDKVEMKVIRKKWRNEIKYRYEIVPKDANNREIPFAGLSTGQKSAILLSLVMSINDVAARGFRVIVFDEIQACGLDDWGLDVMVSMLTFFASVKNIIITSRSNSFINEIESQLRHIDEMEGETVRKISSKKYKIKLQDDAIEIPESVIEPYNSD